MIRTGIEGTRWKSSVINKLRMHEMYIQMSNSNITESGRFLRRSDQFFMIR